MCGILGFTHPDLSTDEASAGLDRALDSIRHRGPDGQGILQLPDLRVSAGMRRLSIIDLAGGDQPIWNEDRTVAVLFNGEIYNYRELRKDLEAKGHVFATDCDTEVLVHLYEEKGEGMLPELRGMFGIALFDLEKDRLLLARDHFGQKSIYYSADPAKGKLAFASELKALHQLPGVDLQIDDDALLEFASFLILAPPRTHFQNVLKLPAGHFIVATLAKNSFSVSEPKAFWAPDSRGEPSFTTMPEAVDAVASALHQSVDLHLRSDVPVGVFLSSGLDSRLVSSYAAEFYGSDLQAFTVGFGEGRSEIDDAARTAQELGICHHGIELDEQGFADALDDALHHLDEPIGDAAAIPLLHLSRFAAERVKVVLSGEGADELFGGYSERYRGRASELRKTALLRPFGPALRLAALAPVSKLRRLAERTRSSEAEEAILLVARTVGLEGQGARLSSERLGQIATRLYKPQRDAEHSLMAKDMSWELPEWLLQKSDKMSMAASLELRSPFLDPALASVAAGIATDLKLPPGSEQGKAVLRKLHARRFPQVGTTPPKKGFPLPLGRWMRGGLRDRMQADLLDSDSPLFPVLDRSHVESLWQRQLDGKLSNPTPLYALWSYCRWRRLIAT